MHLVPVVGSGYAHLDTVPVAQVPLVEILLHGVRGGEQQRRIAARFPDRRPGCIANVKKRDSDGGLNLACHLVHGVGADDQTFRPAPFKVSRRHDHHLRRPVPVAGRLRGLDLGKIE